MERISQKTLENMIYYVNKEHNLPTEYMTDGKINVGHLHLDIAYGGYQLVQTVNDGGGIITITDRGTKRELYNMLRAINEFNLNVKKG